MIEVRFSPTSDLNDLEEPAGNKRITGNEGFSLFALLNVNDVEPAMRDRTGVIEKTSRREQFLDVGV